MKLIVGLGNPGKDYAATRHNAGWLALDALAEHFQLNSGFQTKSTFHAAILKPTPVLLLAKPQTFMNNSGIAVKKMMAYYQIPTSNLYLVYDDLDLALGQSKIQFDKGTHTHNGVNTVVDQLKTQAFWHVRIGTASETSQLIKTQNKSMADDYILKPFRTAERQVLIGVFQQLIKDLLN